MSTMNLEVRDGVHVLSLTNHENENSFDLDVMHEYLAAFDTVERYAGNTALLISCEHEKTFSTGINLNWLMAQEEQVQQAFVLAMETVLYRLALLSAPTVVAINGNIYAGAAILAAACDFRLMRSDLGRFCLPEVNIKMTFPPLMKDIVNLLPDKQAVKIMTLTGKAYTGLECKNSDIVDGIFPADELADQAFDLAKQLSQKDRATYTTIRNDLRPDISRHASALGLDKS